MQVEEIDRMAMTQDEPIAAGFSDTIKAASWNAHEHAEHSRFLQDLLAGRLDRRRYADLVAQHYFAYRVLEEASVAMADDPIGERFSFPELRRLPALEADLADLLGSGWAGSIAPNSATVAYCDRLQPPASTGPAATSPTTTSGTWATSREAR